MTTQWKPQLADIAEHFSREAALWRAWKLRDGSDSMVYAFWDNGVISTYSERGILQKSWRVYGDYTYGG